MKIETKRLEIIPLPVKMLPLYMTDVQQLASELGLAYRGEPVDAELTKAIKEQYTAVQTEKGDYVWNTFWLFVLKDEKAIIGSACFKGQPNEIGDVEIGYGIGTLYQNQGYTTEAVYALCEWALQDKDVKRVIAETEKWNVASQKVLQKCGMIKYKETEGCFWWCLNSPCM